MLASWTASLTWLQALGPGPGNRELDSQGVPQVLRVLVVEVGGHAVCVMVGPDLCRVLADPCVCP